MHLHALDHWQHDHTFGTTTETAGEARTRLVIALTGLMMIAEIAAGMIYGSMALLADGWHMGTHAAALGVTAFAYFYARNHATDRRYSFGTGKVTALGGFASAVGLALVALLVLAESLERVLEPVVIRFDEAIAVAIVGLLVNLLSAWLLRAEDHHHGGHGHGHGHGHGSHRDHNLRAAQMHVLADALTSLLAIAALVTGKLFGWGWMDPVVGIVGAVVIARWSVGLLRDTSRVLLDAEADERHRQAIRDALEAGSEDRVADLHLWRVGPAHLAAIVSVVTHEPQAPDHYKARLSAFGDLAHVTVEVHGCASA